MNRGVLFDSKEADSINQLFKDRVAKHLFLIHNYRPDVAVAFSTDALFLTAVMNLYKLLVDSGLTSNVRCFKKFINADEDFKKLDNYRKTSNTLRTAVGHNPTPEEISEYKKWLRKTIKKNEVKCENDYKIALDKLEETASNVIDIIKRIIDILAVSPNKQGAIETLEKNIIKYYCKESNRKIFQDQLLCAYLGNKGAAQSNMEYQKHLNLQIAEWVRDRYCCPERQEIEELSKLISKGEIQPKDAEKFEQRIYELKETLYQKNKKIADKCNCKPEDLENVPFQYVDYYFKELEEKLENALMRIKTDGVGSMEPEDIIQMVIREDFRLD